MAIHVNIGKGKTRLPELVAAAKRDEEAIIARAGAPEVRLVPVDPDQHKRSIAERRRRAFGSLKGKVSDLDWMAPTPDEELAAWYDAPLFPNGSDEPSR
jgi:antitoxin (DNA-binding transcriptional repressor) of toxin-antitoxin stability system